MNKDLNYYIALEYPVEIRHFTEEDGGGYQATIPMLGRGSFVGHGDTLEEAYNNLNECKKEIFEELLANGIEIIEPQADEIGEYSGKFMVRIPKSLHRDLAESAKLNGTSLNQFITYALSSFEAKWTLVQEVNKTFTRMATHQSNILQSFTISTAPSVHTIMKGRSESYKHITSGGTGICA